MCLAVPGRILDISGEDPILRIGQVDFGGLVKEIHLAYTPEAEIGDHVLIHAGFSISVLDEEEARRVFDALQEMETLEAGKDLAS